MTTSNEELALTAIEVVKYIGASSKIIWDFLREEDIQHTGGDLIYIKCLKQSNPGDYEILKKVFDSYLASKNKEEL